jgi:hypothetical protein
MSGERLVGNGCCTSSGSLRPPFLLRSFLAAGLGGASFQAAGRAGTSLERFVQRSRVFDPVVEGLSSRVDSNAVRDDPALLERRCGDPRVTELCRRVLDRVKGVERTAVLSVLVVALLDPSASNLLRRLTLIAGVRHRIGVYRRLDRSS